MFVQNENASQGKSIGALPAGWFMKEENLEALADAAAPDMFYRRGSVVEVTSTVQRDN